MAQMTIRYLPQIIRIYHQFVDFDLLIDIFDHIFLIDGLIISADIITIKIHIQIIHSLYIWQWHIYEQIIHIKGVFRKYQMTVTQ